MVCTKDVTNDLTVIAIIIIVIMQHVEKNLPPPLSTLQC